MGDRKRAGEVAGTSITGRHPVGEVGEVEAGPLRSPVGDDADAPPAQRRVRGRARRRVRQGADGRLVFLL